MPICFFSCPLAYKKCSCQARNYRVDVLEVNASVFRVSNDDILQHVLFFVLNSCWSPGPICTKKQVGLGRVVKKHSHDVKEHVFSNYCTCHLLQALLQSDTLLSGDARVFRSVTVKLVKLAQKRAPQYG